MKAFLWGTIFIFCSWTLFFIGKGVDNIDIMAERYKRALDAGSNAAAEYRSYSAEAMLLNQGTGYGIGLEDRKNVKVNRDEALLWFYRLFYRNLSIMDAEKQRELKRYIPMKAIILYDRLMIADAEDNWHTYDPAGEKEYRLRYRGKEYKFTLSDQIYDTENGRWIKASDIGLDTEERKEMVTKYIADEINCFLEKSVMPQSSNNYKIVFSMKDAEDEKLSGIEGINFLVLCEGIPIPSLNPFKKESFYAYGLGGSEILR